ncbi:MAG: response regulator [Candidatus Aureabacteria bacterium]|nr:response regulator [Candidatus Auribacterota bacterium]
MKILIVEDEKNFCDLLELTLVQRLNAHVKIVDDMRNIQASAEKYLPDVILLDLGLGGEPNNSGFPVLRNFKRSARTKDIPVIIMTGNRNKEYLVQAFKAGINSYVLKPPEMDDLIERIKKIVQPK